MSDPTGYVPQYSFSGFQANSPTTPLPATKLDNELANISTAVNDHADKLKDVRRSDGALKDGIVTYESLALALQLIFDPTDGQAVANAVAVAQAAATAASGSATAAGASATNAAASAAAAAASAGSVNLSLYLSKAGNLAGIGNADTARGNINAMKTDASDATGRLAPTGTNGVTDWNTVVTNGYFSSSPGAANAPDSTNFWLVHTLVADNAALFVTQIAYQYATANATADTVLVYRRHSYNNGGSRGWTAWQSNSAVPVGTIIRVAATTPPNGFIKLNGALLSRTTYAALFTHAANSGNMTSEASWASGYAGAFSSGDLSTTFRIPDARGEFFRAWDDGRGVDSGRGIGTQQGDLLRDHTHSASQPTTTYNSPGGATNVSGVPATSATTGVNGGLGGSETRPRNIPMLACIKY